MPNETAPNELGEVAVGASDSQYPDRVEDVEKAHEMALAGDELRTNAVKNREVAKRWEDSVYPQKAEKYKKWAEAHDHDADKLEDEAGAAYDQRKAEETRIQDPAMAEAMAHAEEPMIAIVMRLEKTGSPEDAELAKTLREEGDELAQKAGAEYEHGKEVYEKRRKEIVGAISAVIKGEIKLDNDESLRLLWMSTEDEDGGYGDSRFGEEKLYHMIYSLLGAEEPQDENFKKRFPSGNIYRPVFIRTESPDSDLVIVEGRRFEDSGRILSKLHETNRQLHIVRKDSALATAESLEKKHMSLLGL